MPPLRALNGLDYAVVVLYLLAVAAVGLYVARFNRRSTDYFKGGGHIPWGLSAVSLFVSGFSAFMFVGAAGFAYRNGSAALVLFSLAAPAYGLGYLVYGRLWRRTRIETPMQFLARRFSPSTTYFYTLLAVVPNVLILGILVYTLCIFVASALGFGAGTVPVGPFALSGFQLTLVATGLVMIAYTLLGGLWAVMVTDALQFVILLVVSLLVLPVALAFLGDGSLGAGAGRLVREAPPGYFSFTIADQPPAFWLAYFVNIVLGYNVNWHVAQRYYSVPDERGTRRMAAWCAGLSLALPLLWVLPVMAARVLFPDLDARWPGLAEPSEAAFVTLALATLPHGLLGVMTAALFAATMSSVDTTLNWLAAVLTKDVAVPVGRRLRGRAPSERAQLLTGRLCVAALGGVALAVALSMERYGGAFDVYLRVNSLYSAPMFIPVLLGLVYTRTPWWSGMASFGAGVVAVVAASLAANAAQGLPVAALDAVFLPVEVEVLGVAMGRYELNTFAGVLASGLCFFGSALANRRGGAFAERIAALERDLRTPAYATTAARDVRGARAYRIAGALALGLAALLAGVAVAVPEGQGLNLAAAALAATLGAATLAWTRRYAR